MPARKPEILYSCFGLSTFVRKDIEILSDVATVRVFNFHPQKKWQVIPLLFRQFIYLLKHILQARLIIVQFAGYHALLPFLLGKLTGRPRIIVVGGTDAHSFPALRYGNFQKTGLRIATTLTYRLSSIILPKHESLWWCDYRYAEEGSPQQGIRAFLPDLPNKHHSIPNGYDAGIFFMQGIKKKGTFLTVAGGLEYPFQRKLKGIDLILAVAPYFPDNEFILVGAAGFLNENEIPTNVRTTPLLPLTELIREMRQAEFYLQLSMAEGFPNALCEAMLCECVPIGSSVFSIPEIIGDSGFILAHKSEAELKTLISQALCSNTIDLGASARKSISDRFSISRRKTALLNIIQRYLA